MQSPDLSNLRGAVAAVVVATGAVKYLPLLLCLLLLFVGAWGTAAIVCAEPSQRSRAAIQVLRVVVPSWWTGKKRP